MHQAKTRVPFGSTHVSAKALPIVRARSAIVGGIVLLSAIGLSACSSGNPTATIGGSGVGLGGGLAGLTGNIAKVSYSPSSAFSPYGHSVTTVVTGQTYKIVVGGHVTSPKDHLEKIATVRAAEFGKDNNLKFFRVESVAHTMHCIPAKKDRNKVRGHGEIRNSAVTATVTYANTQADPSFRSSRQTFNELRPRLDTDPVVGVPVAAPTPCRSMEQRV